MTRVKMIVKLLRFHSEAAGDIVRHRVGRATTMTMLLNRPVVSSILSRRSAPLYRDHRSNEGTDESRRSCRGVTGREWSGYDLRQLISIIWDAEDVTGAWTASGQRLPTRRSILYLCRAVGHRLLRLRRNAVYRLYPHSDSVVISIPRSWDSSALEFILLISRTLVLVLEILLNVDEYTDGLALSS